MKIGETELAIIDIITFTGILITFLTGVLNLSQNKKSLYINNITRFRVIWITTFRTHIACLKELSNITNLYVRTKDGTNKIAYRRELEKVVALIKMHLNFTGKLDIELISKVEELKSTINSYLLIYYFKNKIKSVKNNDDLINKFYEVIEIISEKKVLQDMLTLAISNGIGKMDSIEKLNLLELKSQVKLSYKNNPELIKKINNESDKIIEKYTCEIDALNEDIDEIVQIYLKAEWIRCKVETRVWPYNRYNEKKVISRLRDRSHRER
ncbi:hypothetical protein [Clostridium sp. BL-8]|uniref:hypothetical protein n=1 Tax=Clostridium sp. BL-8 TaxID=349938 RepID=UPI00098CF002|nr:hypothetical protein [Clostridium sp. BL-8]OOM68449.1 hypothetical protein CLOBL_53400 [Clostridium sp. BL-8]